MITHNLENTLFSDRIITLVNGNIYLDGTVKEVYSNREKLSKLQLNLPFIIRLSYELQQENIVNEIYTDFDDLMEVLWK